MKKPLHRLNYMTGVQTLQSVVLNACTHLRTLDVREGFNLVCELIARGEFRTFSVPTMVNKDGSWIHSAKTMIHCGFRPNGSRLITDEAVLRARTEAEVDGMSPMLKTSLDHDASVKYRFNREIMEAAKGIVEEHPGDFSLAQREYFNTGVREFYLPTKVEVRRERSYADGAGVTYQGGDGCRAAIEYAQGYRVDGANRDFATLLIEEQYKITRKMAKKIRANPRDFLLNPEKWGVKKKKRYRALSAAICLVDMWSDELVYQIIYQDGSSSGYQGMGVAFGCPALCTLTNLGPARHDFYTEVHRLVRLPEGFEYFLTRDMSKMVGIRVAYGASNAAIVVAMILNNPDNASAEVFDGNGVITDEILDTIRERPDLLNEDHKEYILSKDPSEAIGDFRKAVSSYESTIYAISPRLREAVQLMRKSANTVLSAGGILRVPLACGGEYALFQPEIDWDQDPMRLRKKVKGVEVSASLRPLKNGATASMLAPDFMHGAWDSQVRHLGNVFAARAGIPTSDVHDSHGTSPAFCIQAKEHWRDAYIQVGSGLPGQFQHILAQGNVRDPEKTNPRAWDMFLLKDSEYFIR